MFNLKISLILLTAVAAIIAGGLMVNNEYLVEVFDREAIHDLTVTREAMLRAGALDAHGQAAIADQVVAWPKFSEKLLKAYPEGIDGLDERHQAVWEELNVWHAKLLAANQAQQKEKVAKLLEHERALVPSEMFVIDSRGSVVARFTDYAWWGNNVARELPVVLEVGQTRKKVRDLWSPAGGMLLDVLVAPIFAQPPAVPSKTPPPAGATAPAPPQELFLGTIVLGFRMNDAEAERLKRLFGKEVVFFYGKQVVAGTLGAELQEKLQKEIMEKTEVSWNGRLSPHDVHQLSRRSFRMTAGLYTALNQQATAGFILLLDRDRALQPVKKLNLYIPLAGGAIFLFLLVVTAVIIRGFVRPFELLDQGIHEVINGNFEYQFPTPKRDTLVGNMAHSLNLMICTLLGRPILGDEEEETAVGHTPPPTSSEAGGWKDPLFIDDVTQVRKRPELVGLPGGKTGLRPPTPLAPEQAPPAELTVDRVEAGSRTQELAIETEENYLNRLFEEYLSARRETGEGTRGITKDKFLEKIKASEQQIKEQLGCRMVRFRVQKKDGRVTLKPIPIE